MPNNIFHIRPFDSTTICRFEGFEDTLPDPSNYNNGDIICIRDGYNSRNTRFYANLNSQWIYLNQALNNQQDEVVIGYTGFQTISSDFKPVKVDDNLNIVRNDAHFKELLDNKLKELGVIDA